MIEDAPIQHSFGGSRLDRHIFEFETPEGGAAGGEAAAGVLDHTALEGGEVQPAADELDDGNELDPELEPGAAQPTPLSREDVTALLDERVSTGVSAGLRELLAEAQRDQAAQQAAAKAQEENQPPEWDFMNPGDYMAWHSKQLLEQVRELVAPAMEAADVTFQKEGEQAANQEFDRLEEQMRGRPKQEGDEPLFERGQATKLAAFYAGHGIAPEQAIERAAQESREYEERITKRAQDALVKRGLANGELKPELPAGGGAALQKTEPTRGPRGYEEALAASLARAGRRPGVTVPTG